METSLPPPAHVPATPRGFIITLHSLGADAAMTPTSVTGTTEAPALLTRERPALPQGQVLQARVLQDTLMSPGTTRPAPASGNPLLGGAPSATGTPPPTAASPGSMTESAATRFQALIEVRGQTLLIRSATPLPGPGERLQVSLDGQGQLRWLDAPVQPNVAAPRAAADAPAGGPPAPGSAPGNSASPPGSNSLSGAGSAAAPLRATAPTPPAVAGSEATAGSGRGPAVDSDWLSALRRDLPRQAEPVDLARGLQQALQAGAGARLPANVAALASAWLEQLPDTSRLQQPEALRQALQDSGRHLEARLREATTQVGGEVLRDALARDGKAGLLRLLTGIGQALATTTDATGKGDDASRAMEPTAIPGTPPGMSATNAPVSSRGNRDDTTTQLLRQLLGLTQGSLSRLQLQQLDSLGTRPGATPEPGQPHQTWHFELPVRHGSQFEQLGLRLEEYRRREDEGWVRNWHVALDLDLGALGRFSARLNLSGENLTATLWAERETTHHLVRSGLATLRQGLEGAGARVRQLDCHLGNPPARPPRHSGSILDVRT